MTEIQPIAKPDQTEITTANWYWGPANRWSWWNTRRLFPTARVSRGGGPATSLASAPQDLMDIGFTDPVSGAAMTIGRMLDATYTDAFLVLHRDTIVSETYLNGMGPDDPHLLMSVTKSVVGSLAGILAARGEIDVSQPVTESVPELAGTVYDGATLRQVIDMVVADSAYDNEFPVALMQSVDEAAGWIPPTPSSAPGIHAWLAGLRRPRGPHGERFLYLTQSTLVAGWVMERLTGRDLAEMIGTEIWAKLGAEHDAFMLLDRHQAAYSCAGLNTTARDLARFGRMMALGGRYNGQQIVPEAWVEDIRTNGDPAAWLAGNEGARRIGPFPQHDNGSYRAFWWIAEPACGRFTGVGLGGQLLVVDPVSDIVVVKFSSTPDDVVGGTATRTQYAGIVAIIEALDPK